MKATRQFVSLCAAGLVGLCISVSAFAFHPISKLGPYDLPYPEYPKIDYGIGDKAKVIKRGEYLAKIGDCLACHTNVQDKSGAFAGGLELKTPFGNIFTPNITPDDETGIGKWTDNDFIRAMQEGVSPDGKNYFPVFPYLYYAKTSKDDIRAIFAYLKAVPAVKRHNQNQPFPFNMPGSRFGVKFWNMLYFNKYRGEYQYDPSYSQSWNRGAYLVRGLGHCAMCHTPMNALGAAKRQYDLTGGFIDGYWAPNITSYGLKSASVYEVADVFVNGQLINKAGPVAGPMAEVNHDSLQYLNEYDRLAIAEYLKSVKSQDPRSLAPSQAQPTLKRGKQVYINACVICHQEGVAGAPKIGDGDAWTERLKDQGLAALYRHTIQGFNNMPVRGACVTCSDNDIKAAVDYVLNKSLTRSQWHGIKSGKVGVKVSKANGQSVYEENCAACHAEGKTGAPKVGDKKTWNILLRKNMDVLMINAVKGKDGVHVRGGCEHCSNAEVIAAVKFMVQESTDKDFALWGK